MFCELGRLRGYRPQRSFSRDHPTDGVWFVDDWEVGALPMVAAEVVVTEGKKAMRGSIATLEAVSPALGVIVLQDDEIRRGLIRKGQDLVEIERRIEATYGHLVEFAGTSKQRIVVWRFSQLARRYQLAAGRRSLYQAA